MQFEAFISALDCLTVPYFNHYRSYLITNLHFIDTNTSNGLKLSPKCDIHIHAQCTQCLLHVFEGYPDR